MIVAFRSVLLAPLLLVAASAAFAQQPATPPTPPAPPSAPSAPDAPSAPTPPTPPLPDSPMAAPLPDSPDTHAPSVMRPTGPTAVFDSSMGRMTCELYSDQAPVTVANFIGLATGTKDWTNPSTHQKEQGVPLYNGTTFHRVIPGFMIQGGDPIGDGTGDPGYMINDEIIPGLVFDVPGRLAMANSGPNTDGSQFFITEAPQPSLDGSYTIFGQCDDSAVSVVKAIARVDRDSRDKPLIPVTLNKVTIVAPGQPLPPLPAQPASADTPAAAGSLTGPSF